MNKSHAARKMRNWEEKKFLLDFKKKKRERGKEQGRQRENSF